ncbi:FtsK/SpoIIIE domain-containing protein [Streptomyces sp. NPDC051104]|uniref:FtsK/SpoIIIE domain-containing protein n=1 Tax=Streptomyces sp. NPDC051104 TaxID=3155044 RepID=UPI0034269C3B
MSIETTPSSSPDPEWERIVSGYINEPETEPVQPRPANLGKTTLGEDLGGDTPITPQWIKSREGWKSRSRIAARQTVRNSRHWLRRQRTEHGYLPMLGRGVARVYRWTAGAEGATVHAARIDAQVQAEEAERANWKYRRKMLPGKEKDRLLAVAQQQKDEAIAAHNVLQKTRAAARRAIAFRAVASVGMPAATVTASGIYGGTLGLTTASLAVATGLGWIGRHTNSGSIWEERRLSIGDGDPMTDTMLNQAYRAARVIGVDDELKLVTPCLLTKDGRAWQVTFDLPPGTPAKKAFSAREGLAGAFGVAVQQLHQTGGEREGRINLRVSLTVPFTDKTGPKPLLAAERINLWRPVPAGVNLRGEPVDLYWVERSGLFGGEPGSGKSSAANTLLLAAALDPTVRMYLADGKAGADVTPFEPIATMYDTDGDPERLLEIFEHVWTVEVPERRALAKEHGSRKLTAEMAAVDPRVCLAVLLVDEWSSYSAMAELKLRQELDRLLRLIVQQGRALGIITLAATQKPDSDSVPTGIRDILSIRWAMRCLTPEASDTILTKGRASAGFNAQQVLKSQQGVGFLMDGDADPELARAHYYDDDEVDAILKRAYALREEAGTLPMGPLDKMRAAGDDGVILADLVDLYAAEGVQLLPAARVLEGLNAAGHTVTADRLAVLVPRTDEERKRQEIDGSKVSVYPLAAVRRAVADRYGIAV